MSGMRKLFMDEEENFVCFIYAWGDSDAEGKSKRKDDTWSCHPSRLHISSWIRNKFCLIPP